MSSGARFAIAFALFVSAAGSLLADEIKLKDGKKLYGVIVGYEDNMFRVKTDFGYVLVEKDKIAAIVPTGDGGNEAASAAPATAKTPSKPADGKPAGSAKTAGGDKAAATASNNAKVSDAPVKPSLSAATSSGNVAGPTIRVDSGPENTLAAGAQQPAPPKDPELPPNHEEVQGTLYTNFSHGFRMYKAPSWGLIEDARQALPNAIVAMGTSNESTLMVVGQEKMKDSLDLTAAAVEKRLKEIYTNYRLISQRKTVVGGSSAAEYRYRGTADDHDWSGTLVVIGRGKEVLTMLGMTYADSDLIQIQENVIARAIASTDFNVPKYSAEK
jgi:hypothetical protein